MSDSRTNAAIAPAARADAWSRFGCELDHLVVAAGSLGAGSAWLQERLGVPLERGGRHPGWGTHNRLLSLGAGAYLELIAPDRTQPPPDGPRPFGLDRPELRAAICQRPRLVHFVVRSARLDEAVAAVGYDPGPVRAMSRGELRWRITLPVDGNPAGGGLLPTLIAWDAESQARHPAKTLAPSGVRLEELRIVAPPQVAALLAGLDADAPIRIDAAPDSAGPGTLRAVFSTPRGPAIID